MDMRNGTRGFYTLEAAIILPIVVLAILSLGYFMKVEGAWERSFYEAVDESSQAAMKAYDDVSYKGLKGKIERRILKDSKNLEYVRVLKMRNMYRSLSQYGLTSYTLEAGMRLELPLGLNRDFKMKTKVKYRNFIGLAEKTTPLGDGLERDVLKDPVWIFPHEGEKYHNESCTYVKASAVKKRLSGRLKKRYDPCAICDSGSMKAGEIVFCFEKEGKAYHRGICRTLNRKAVKADRSDAKKRGYTPCSKCGGG